MPGFISEEQAQAMIDKAVAEALLKLNRAPRPFKIFGLNSSNPYAGRIASHLNIELTKHEELNFADGENFAKSANGIHGNVRGHNVFVIQSLYSDEKDSVSDKFVKLCWMIGSLRDASTHEIIVVIPHLAWARQDRKTASREPITTKYVAQMLEAVGMDHGLFLDVHNLAAEQNAFRVPIDNLEAKNLYAEYAADVVDPNRKIAVYSPDSGGLPRCKRFRGALVDALKRRKTPAKFNIEIAVFDKTRKPKKAGSGNTEIEGGVVIGDVEGAQVFELDDMISTFGTAMKAGLAIEPAGGDLKAIFATHGLFCGNANEKLDKLPESVQVVICDTVSPWRLSKKNKKRVVTLSTVEMVADAIARIHYGTGSISELLA